MGVSTQDTVKRHPGFDRAGIDVAGSFVGAVFVSADPPSSGACAWQAAQHRVKATQPKLDNCLLIFPLPLACPRLR